MLVVIWQPLCARLPCGAHLLGNEGSGAKLEQAVITASTCNQQAASVDSVKDRILSVWHTRRKGKEEREELEKFAVMVHQISIPSLALASLVVKPNGLCTRRSGV